MNTRVDQPRTPAGSPQGGEFATKPGGAESQLTLDTTTNPFRQRYDTMEEKLEAIQNELADAVDRLSDDAEWTNYLDTMSKFHNYSAQNQLLIWIQKRDATRVAGFNRWKQVGRHVKAGERGLTILAPKVRVVDADKDDAGAFFDNRTNSWKRRFVSGFTTTSVFDISQTDGDPLPEGRRELTLDPPEGLRQDLEDAITAEGFTIEYVESLGGANGATSPTHKTVQVLSTMSPADQVSTLAHELGHIKAGHLERMDEYHTGHGGARTQMEVEAESISYVLCRTNGMDVAGKGHHDRYISGWSGVGAGADEVKKASQTIQKTVASLLSERSWRNLDPVVG